LATQKRGPAPEPAIHRLRNRSLLDKTVQFLILPCFASFLSVEVSPTPHPAPNVGFQIRRAPRRVSQTCVTEGRAQPRGPTPGWLAGGRCLANGIVSHYELASGDAAAVSALASSGRACSVVCVQERAVPQGSSARFTPLGTHTHDTMRHGMDNQAAFKRGGSPPTGPVPLLPPPAPFLLCTLLFLVCVLVALRAVVGTCRRWPSSLLLLLSSPFLFTRAPGTGLSTLQPPAWPRGAPPPPQHPRRPRRRPAPRSRRWPCRPARRRADPPRRR